MCHLSHMAYTRASTRKRGTKRYRNGKFIKSRRTTTRKTVRVKRRRGSIRKLNGVDARAYFDASRWHHRPELSVPDQISEYTPVRGVHRVDVNGPTAAGGSAIYIFCWTPSAARCMWLTHQTTDNPEYYQVAFPFIASHTEASGPALCRPLRGSIAVRNISASQNVAGVIRVLSTNHPLEWVLTYGGSGTEANVNIHSSDHANVVSMIGSHPKTRTVTNAELRSGISIPIIPASMAQYKEYHDWVEVHPITNTRITESDGSLNMIPGQMSNEQKAGKLIEEWTKKTPMSTVIIEIPTASSGFMSYDIAYHYQDAVRAKDPEGLTAQFARAARPANSTAFASMAHTAQTRI